MRAQLTRGQGSTDCVSNFMVCHQRLALAVNHGGALHASHNPVYTVVHLSQGHSSLAASTSENGSLQARHLYEYPCLDAFIASGHCAAETRATTKNVPAHDCTSPNGYLPAVTALGTQHA